jgi:hypothetical protein
MKDHGCHLLFDQLLNRIINALLKGGIERSRHGRCLSVGLSLLLIAKSFCHELNEALSLTLSGGS